MDKKNPSKFSNSGPTLRRRKFDVRRPPDVISYRGDDMSKRKAPPDSPPSSRENRRARTDGAWAPDYVYSVVTNTRDEGTLRSMRLLSSAWKTCVDESSTLFLSNKILLCGCLEGGKRRLAETIVRRNRGDAYFLGGAFIAAMYYGADWLCDRISSETWIPPSVRDRWCLYLLRRGVPASGELARYFTSGDYHAERAACLCLHTCIHWRELGRALDLIRCLPWIDTPSFLATKVPNRFTGTIYASRGANPLFAGMGDSNERLLTDVVAALLACCRPRNDALDEFLSHECDRIGRARVYREASARVKKGSPVSAVPRMQTGGGRDPTEPWDRRE